jgi:hypothetical protein
MHRARARPHDMHVHGTKGSESCGNRERGFTSAIEAKTCQLEEIECGEEGIKGWGNVGPVLRLRGPRRDDLSLTSDREIVTTKTRNVGGVDITSRPARCAWYVELLINRLAYMGRGNCDRSPNGVD